MDSVAVESVKHTVIREVPSPYALLTVPLQPFVTKLISLELLGCEEGQVCCHKQVFQSNLRGTIASHKQIVFSVKRSLVWLK